MSLSRRDFLKLVGLGAAGAIGGRALPGLWPVAEAQTLAFPMPSELRTRTASGGVAVALRAEVAEVPIAGRKAQLWTYNGSFPGPTLRVREGECVQLDFTNALPEPTNLHFHGLHISPTGDGDNIFRYVAPGKTVRYAFTVPEGSAGTFWYHPHLHGTVSPQLFRGLAGAILVEGLPDAALRDLPEHLLVLKDLEFRADGAVPNHSQMDWAMGREGSLLSVNGTERPTLRVPKGAARLRLLNASNARYYHLRVPSATVQVLATDGGFVAEPYPVDELLLAPGERYEVLVQFPGRGRYELVTLPYDRAPEEMGKMEMRGMTMPGGRSDGEDVRTLLMHFEVDAPGAYRLPTALAAVTPLSPEDAVRRRRIVLSEDMARLEFFIDGKLFDPKRTDFAPRLGTLEHWEFVNESGMDHPMHLHVHPFQVYARGGVRELRPAWKDVVNVPAKGSVELLVPFTDFAGKTVMHCHIVEHEDFGMMSVVNVA